MPAAIGIVALVFFVFALSAASAELMKSISGPVSTIPGIGGIVKSVLDGIRQGLDWACGQLVAGLDAMMGAVWHVLARSLDDTWKYFELQASGLLQLAQIVAGGFYNVSGLHALVNAISSVAHRALSLVNHLDRELRGIEAGVKQIEHELAKGIGNDVRSTVDELRKWEKKAKAQLTSDEKAITKTLPGEIASLRNFLGIKPLTSYLGWAAALVAGALGLNSLNSFLCNEFKTITNRGCSNLWGGLEDLLGLFIDAIALTHLCDLPVWINEFFGPVEAELVDLMSHAANAFCAKPGAGYPTMTVAALSLPTPSEVTATL